MMRLGGAACTRSRGAAVAGVGAACLRAPISGIGCRVELGGSNRRRSRFSTEFANSIKMKIIRIMIGAKLKFLIAVL